MQFLDNSKRIFRVWLANIRASLVREMEFRANFVLGLIRQTLWLLAFVLFIEVIFRNTSSLAGWNEAEVLVILALSRIIEGTMNTFFVDNIIRISERVQQGTFDFVLTKPLPIQFAAFFSKFSLQNIGNIVVGIALLIYAFTLDPSFVRLDYFLSAIVLALAGITIYYSILVIVASLVFYIERLESLWGFNVLFSEPLTTPFDVFPYVPRITLTYLLPLAFVVFVPAQALTGRLVWWQLPVAIGLTIVFLLLANLAWRAGLRRYTSASS